MLLISESGMYSFLGASRKPKAKRLMRIIKKEVLPEIILEKQELISIEKNPTTLKFNELFKAIFQDHEFGYLNIDGYI